MNGIVNTSNSLKGCPYKYGGSSPEGFDCSGFEYIVINKMDIIMYHELVVKLQTVVLKEMLSLRCSLLEWTCWNVIHAYGTNNGKVRTDPISKVS